MIAMLCLGLFPNRVGRLAYRYEFEFEFEYEFEFEFEFEDEFEHEHEHEDAVRSGLLSWREL